MRPRIDGSLGRSRIALRPRPPRPRQDLAAPPTKGARHGDGFGRAPRESRRDLGVAGGRGGSAATSSAVACLWAREPLTVERRETKLWRHRGADGGPRGEKHQNRCQGPRQRRQEGAMSRLPHGWPDENVEPSAGIDCRWSNLEADDEGSTEAKHRMLRGVACLREHPGKPRLACPGALCDPQCRSWSFSVWSLA